MWLHHTADIRQQPDLLTVMLFGSRDPGFQVFKSLADEKGYGIINGGPAGFRCQVYTAEDAAINCGVEVKMVQA